MYTTSQVLSLVIAGLGLGISGLFFSWKVYRVATADSFRVTNPKTGKSAIISSRVDTDKLLEVMQ